MSSDLLAEFDSFYRAPQTGAPSHTSTSSTSLPTSALEDLSILEVVNPAPNKSILPEPQWNIPSSKPSVDTWGNLDKIETGNMQHTTAVQASDPWGSFESGRNLSAAGHQNPGLQEAGYAGNLRGKYREQTCSSKSGIVRRPTIDIFSSNVIDLVESTTARRQDGHVKGNSSRGTTPQHAGIKIPPKSTGTGDILFDAVDELNGNEDDDFGDFETVSSPTPQIDLLQIGSTVQAEKSAKWPSKPLNTKESLDTSPFPYPQAPKSPSFRERNPFSGLVLATSPAFDLKNEASKAESPVTAWPTYEQNIPDQAPYHDSPVTNDPEEEDWGDFADLPAENNDTKPSKSGIEADVWAWDAVDSQTAAIPTSSAEAPPPTNIPPPSILLAIFPQLFSLPQSSLFQAVANQPLALKNRVLSNPSTIDFLRSYILLATVAARIMAGRKLRWKRDTNLSQAMKIGPAAAQGKGGLKLTGVDRMETTREEREVADLIRIWGDQVGRLRSVVAAANSGLQGHSAHLAVPEINENMTVKAEGVLTAPKPCVLCGLKREERIPKVDIQVEDSFGEWWVEHWGHRACRNFWQENEGKLKQR